MSYVRARTKKAVASVFAPTLILALFSVPGLTKSCNPFNEILYKELTHLFPLPSPDNRNKNFFNNPWEVHHKGFPTPAFKVIEQA
jgi:hypothetical protein